MTYEEMMASLNQDTNTALGTNNSATNFGPTVSNAAAITPPKAPTIQTKQPVIGETPKTIDAAAYAGMTPEQQEQYRQGILDSQNLGALDYANLGIGVAGAATNIASYFDNRSMMKKQKEALSENIVASREERAHRKSFRDKTATAFA